MRRSSDIMRAILLVEDKVERVDRRLAVLRGRRDEMQMALYRCKVDLLDLPWPQDATGKVMALEACDHYDGVEHPDTMRRSASMANEAANSDPLAWLAAALGPDLAKIDASAEFHRSSPDRGSLTINRMGKVVQTCYFASFELRAMREGGAQIVEKQRQAIVDQVHRISNPHPTYGGPARTVAADGESGEADRVV